MTENDRIEEALNRAFGTSTVHWWPQLPPLAPRWWQTSQRKTERRINTALASVGLGPINDGMRARFWEQARLGQDVCEDAGGYFLRRWWAALGLPFRPHQEDYEAAAERLINEAISERAPRPLPSSISGGA